jgi:hypothetical protein
MVNDMILCFAWLLAMGCRSRQATAFMSLSSKNFSHLQIRMPVDKNLSLALCYRGRHLHTTLFQVVLAHLSAISIATKLAYTTLILLALPGVLVSVSVVKLSLSATAFTR